MRKISLLIASLLFATSVAAQTYIQGPALIQTPTTTATAAGTTTLTNASQTNQQFTGSTTQTVVLPSATTLPKGRAFYVSNRSSGTVTVNFNGGSLAKSMPGGSETLFIVENNASSAGTWDVSGGTVVLGVGLFDSQIPSSNGAVASANFLYLQSASATVPGLVNNTTQSMSGNKTFTGTIAASNLSGTNTGDVTIGSFGSTPNANGLSIASQVLNLQPADATHSGGLSSTDWNTFNNKQSTITTGNLTDAGTDGIIVTSGSGAVIGSGTSLAQHVSDSTHNGYLSSTDWSTFNGKQASGNYITALTGDGSASGPGSAALTLAATQNNITSIPNLSTVGTVTSGTWSATTIVLNKGGTGQTTKAAAFDALSPMNTGGDLIYGGASGTGTRLPNGSANQYLASAGGTNAHVWTSFVAPTVQTLTSASATYTTPTSPRTPLYLVIEMVGAGGGGGGSGTASAGNGANGAADTVFSVHSGAAILTAGKGGGGSAGQSQAAGGSGGTCTIAAGATKIKAVAGGQGGATSQGSITSAQAGGIGGASAYGGAGSGGALGSAGNAAASLTGAGGGGGGSAGGVASDFSGAGGGSGCFIKAFIFSPSASYDYSMGLGGAAGLSGTNGSAGAAGGSAEIIVTEFYQ